MADEPGATYRVDRVPQVDDQIRALADRAAALNLREPYLDALKAMVRRLKTDPLAWGDPEYRTHQQGGVVCHALQPPLIIHYVVFEAERVVCVLAVKPLPGHPLSTSP